MERILSHQVSGSSTQSQGQTLRRNRGSKGGKTVVMTNGKRLLI